MLRKLGLRKDGPLHLGAISTQISYSTKGCVSNCCLLSSSRGGVILDPLDLQVGLILVQIVVVEGLLGEVGRHYIVEGNQCVALLCFYCHILYLAKDSEDLHAK